MSASNKPTWTFISTNLALGAVIAYLLFEASESVPIMRNIRNSARLLFPRTVIEIVTSHLRTTRGEHWVAMIRDGDGNIPRETRAFADEDEALEKFNAILRREKCRGKRW
jgi:hypothetical protein